MFFVVDGSSQLDDATLAACGARRGFSPNADVVVRSSGQNETLASRGEFDSAECLLPDVAQTIQRLTESLPPEERGHVHWIVQAKVRTRAKGHLSNERRVTPVARDWVAEVEPAPGVRGESLKVAVRRWRQGEPPLTPIKCDLLAKLAKSLREPAAWAGTTRAHMEWVWNGDQIFIVQYDEVDSSRGVRPQSLVADAAAAPSVTGLEVFREATARDFDTYRKLANARLYAELGYKLPSFVVLDDPKTIDQILKGKVSTALHRDLKQLCGAPLVLRTDGVGFGEGKKQMLPRSDELRSVEQAVEWLTKDFRKKIEKCETGDAKLAFLGHHFIPAVASAWCLAHPDRRRVRIEALWGIPEGLYYYSHDVYDIDTGHVDAKRVDSASCRVVHRKVRFKEHFFAPDKNGDWIVHECAAGPDWAPCVSNDKVLSEIAATSRKIAQRENMPVVVMWFIGMPEGVSTHPAIPWYHEEWTAPQDESFRNAPRRNALSREVRVLRRAADLEQLLDDTARGVSVGYVAIDPEEGGIVRERSFIERLAEDASAHGYEVQLRGGVLSHAFYALARHGCKVSCVDLVEQDEGEVEYNKLVRDKIPSNIRSRGEDVESITLRSEALLAALKAKIVEEALEVKDSTNAGAIEEELADVLEVVRAIADVVDLKMSDIEAVRQKKKDARGGFDLGQMLTRTRLPGPIGDIAIDGESRRTVSRADELPLEDTVFNSDLRLDPNVGYERRLSIVVPIGMRSDLAFRDHVVDLPFSTGRPHPMRLTANFSRDKDDIRIKLSIVNGAMQPDLFAQDTRGEDDH